ncbi:MAG TPA: condensation domain-containing protein, partial [Roseiarcus sp.]|nr:condensation domain-containing protein [Roseiarcus sp.]
GAADNELTRYRYDVVLRVGEVGEVEEADAAWLDWSLDQGPPARLGSVLRDARPALARIDGVVNRRVARDLASLRLLRGGDDRQLVGEMREACAALETVGEDPEEMWALGEAEGYEVRVSWTPGSSGERFDVAMIDRAQVVGEPIAKRSRIALRQPLSAYGNDPLALGLTLGLAGRLRGHLQRKLPDYMVPSAFVVLDKLPLTPNGKIDRKALPAPEGRPAGLEYVAPRDLAEEQLAAIWGEVLRLDKVGVEDNFFELGGHSLLATRVVALIRDRMGVETPLRAMFEAPTVAGLSERLARLRGEALSRPPLAPQPRPAAPPLSFAQERLWFLDRLGLVGSAYNMPGAFRLEGPVDAQALEASLTELTRRHESLRTRFEERDGEPIQIIDPPARFELATEDVSALEETARMARAMALGREEVVRPFDLALDHLLRARLLRFGPQDHLLLLTMHHIVSDGWSIGVLARELATVYAAYDQGRPSPLPEPELQYADYALWQRGWLQGEALAQQVAYWRERLSGAPAALELPTDRPRPATASFEGAAAPFALSPELSAALLKLAQAQGATLYMVLLAAFQTVLGRWSGQDDIVVGSPIAGRTHRQTEDLIGFFVNTLAMRTDLSGDPTFLELLHRVKETALGAYAHQDLPFEKLVAELQPVRDLSRQPLFQVCFALQNTRDLEARTLAGLKLSSLDLGQLTAKFDLSLLVWESPIQLHGYIEYATDLFDLSTIERLTAHLTRVLAEALRRPARRQPAPVRRLRAGARR